MPWDHHSQGSAPGWGADEKHRPISTVKITGGSFGTDGHLVVTPYKTVKIEGSRNAAYANNQIDSIDAREVREKKFGVIGFILGAIILSVVLAPFLGLLGVIVGVVAAAMGSFHSKARQTAEIRFDDGKGVTVEAEKRQIESLYRCLPDN